MKRFTACAMLRLSLALMPLMLVTASFAADTPMPWRTAVRLTSQRGNMAQVGSGTVVASSGERSAVLTCAHLFKGAAINSAVRVDLFTGQMMKLNDGPGRLTYLESHAGRLTAIDPSADLALVEFAPSRVLEASPIAPDTSPLSVGQPLTAVGCGEGKDATVWSTVVLKLGMGVSTSPGAKFTECQSDPKQGRSGGGLFTTDGYLVGVCNFGEPTGHTGLYAAPEGVRSFVARSFVPTQFGLQRGCPPSGVCTSLPPMRAPQVIVEPQLVIAKPQTPAVPAVPAAPEGLTLTDRFRVIEAALPEGTEIVAALLGLGTLFVPWRRFPANPAAAAASFAAINAMNATTMGAVAANTANVASMLAHRVA